MHLLDMICRDPSVKKDGVNYMITGVLLDCENGLVVVPNMRFKFYESDKDLTEYKINFQFKF